MNLSQGARRLLTASFAVFSVFSALFVFGHTVFPQRLVTLTNPEVKQAAKFDVSPPLRSIKPVVGGTKKASDDKGPGGPVGDTRHDPDPALQSETGTGFFSTINGFAGTVSNFEGMGGLGSTPPDPNGDIGPNHFVQVVNARIQIFTRSGTSVFGPSNINTLFAGFGGPCQIENAGDPVVLYDQVADRWLVSQFSDSSGPFFNCVAISQTGDPTGSYYRYAFEAPTFPDYPKYGIWSDGYYLTTRESAGGVLGMYALERDQMIAGNPAARVVRFTVPEVGGGVGPNGLLSADMDGTVPPPPGSPNYLVGSRDDGAGAPSDALILYKFQVNWTSPASSTFTGPTILPTAPFDTIFPCTPTSRQCIPQPGTTTKIDILSYRQRPTFRLAYRNFGTHESLVTTQSVEASTGIAGMRWWEIRSPNVSPTIYQEGTYGPGATDGIHRWMGSIAMDRRGNIALGYSVSDATSVYPGIRFTGRLVNDPLGQMAQGEGTIIDGGGSQTSTANRWGDYTSLTVDPIDDCTFWYVNQYYASTSTTAYKTRIASFRFPTCISGIPPIADFDGDRKTDLSIFRPSVSEWWYQRSGSSGSSAAQFGSAGDKIVPGDYTGDGKSDLAVWRPSNGGWYVFRSENSTFYSFPFGASGDVPAPGDFDGDGKTDAAVFRPSSSTWFINLSGGGTTIQSFGAAGDVPVAADYDGDGKSDIAIYRPSAGQWWLLRSTAGLIALSFGNSTDKPAAGDYTGDGKADPAFFRPATGEWFVLRSENQSFYSFTFGASGDIPAPGDYDGDGRLDAAVFRPSNATWYLNRSTSGALIQQFGAVDDIPVPNAFVR